MKYNKNIIYYLLIIIFITGCNSKQPSINNQNPERLFLKKPTYYKSKKPKFLKIKQEKTNYSKPKYLKNNNPSYYKNSLFKETHKKINYTPQKQNYNNQNNYINDEEFKNTHSLFLKENKGINFKNKNPIFYTNNYIKSKKDSEKRKKYTNKFITFMKKIISIPSNLTNYLFMPFNEIIDKKYNKETSDVLKEGKKTKWER